MQCNFFIRSSCTALILHVRRRVSQPISFKDETASVYASADDIKRVLLKLTPRHCWINFSEWFLLKFGCFECHIWHQSTDCCFLHFVMERGYFKLSHAGRLSNAGGIRLYWYYNYMYLVLMMCFGDYMFLVY